jgi:hypothetical protein
MRASGTTAVRSPGSCLAPWTITQNTIAFARGGGEGRAHSQLAKLRKELSICKELKPLVIGAIKAKF